MGSHIEHEIRMKLNDEDYLFLHVMASMNGRKGIADIARAMLEDQIEIEKEKNGKKLAEILKPKKR